MQKFISAALNEVLMSKLTKKKTSSSANQDVYHDPINLIQHFTKTKKNDVKLYMCVLFT